MNSAMKQNEVGWTRRVTALTAAALLFLCSQQAHARSMWLTGRTVQNQTTPLSAGTNGVATTATLGAVTAMGSAVPDNGLIDITISLYNSPSGDDDGNVQSDLPSEQDKIERIIQYFADGVYEATEGAHRIRNVRIYRNGARNTDCDVLWVASLDFPNVGPGGGVGEPGGHINFPDVFVKSGNRDMLGYPEGAGYTLAHEWGHYFYGVYDEYVINQGDEAVVPSIMGYQWSAAENGGRHYEYLNFSVRWRGGTSGNYGPYENTRHTRQHRVMGESDWETIARVPTSVESSAWLWWVPISPGAPVPNLGRRVHYPELENVAPTFNNPSVNLSTTDPLSSLPSRADLNIRWMGSNIVMQIVIDHSPSMSDFDKIGKAKTAAKILVDAVELGTDLGLIEFDGVATVLHPISKIANDADRTVIKGQIDSITLGSATAVGDAARAALNGLIAHGLSNTTAAVFLLTDGQSNTGSDPLSVIPDYQNAQVPIMGFGFGSDADPRLKQMALATGGKYYDAPTTLAAVQRAFQDANATVASRVQVASGQFSAPDTSVHTISTFQVDPTLRSLYLTVTYAGGPGDASLSLVAPNGTQNGPSSTQQSGIETVLTFSIDNPAAGEWQLVGIVAAGVNVSFQGDGATTAATYSLASYSGSGDVVTRPDSLRIVAHLSKVQAIDLAGVWAAITDPAGTVSRIQLISVLPGTYAGEINPTGPAGTYNVVVSADNSAGQAVLTYGGDVMSLPQGATIAPPPPADQPVAENFSRVTTFQVTVNGAANCELVCPANMVVSNDAGQCGAVVNYPPATVNGSCSTVTCNLPPGSFFTVGTTVVTCSSEAGPSCTFSVTVNDTERPRVSCSVTKPTLWSPKHEMVNVGLTATASDNCAATLPVGVQMFGNEDDEMPTGDGNFSPDAKNIAAGTLRLRSERVGTGKGRVYLIVTSATDASGNKGINCCTVVVPKDSTKASLKAVNALATAAKDYVLSHNGAPPAGYFVIGDGATIGPLQ